MNLTFVEYHPQSVLAAFRRGEFDGLEVIGQADERDFFHRCFQERLLSRLAQPPPCRSRSFACGTIMPMAYAQLPVVSFTREAILLEGEAREKALRKLDQLETLLFTPISNPRPM